MEQTNKEWIHCCLKDFIRHPQILFKMLLPKVQVRVNYCLEEDKIGILHFLWQVNCKSVLNYIKGYSTYAVPVSQVTCPSCMHHTCLSCMRCRSKSFDCPYTRGPFRPIIPSSATASNTCEYCHVHFLSKPCEHDGMLGDKLILC